MARRRWLVLGSALFLPTVVGAQSHSSGHTDPVSAVVLGLAIILVAAKMAGHFAVRVGQPAVLGELVAGVALGSADLVGLQWFHAFETDVSIEMLKEGTTTRSAAMSSAPTYMRSSRLTLMRPEPWMV